MKRIIAAISLLLLAAFFCFAQAPLPRGYGGIELGMTLDEVKEKLKKNSEFGYHGDRDVSLLPGENRVLIETDTAAGHVNSFLERCYFQFYNEKLYIIIINVNRERMDHYSIFSTLCENMAIHRRSLLKNQNGEQTA